MPIEFKTVPVYELKAEGDDERTKTGLAAVCGNVDNGYDRLWSGAFVKTIKERGNRVRHLWQHEFDDPPIATILELREIGREELPQDLRAEYPQITGGLLVKRRYLDTHKGNEVLAGLNAAPPAITEMSFGFDAIKYDFEEMDMEIIRNLREVRLWDTSDVNWGMNPLTAAQKDAAPPSPMHVLNSFYQVVKEIESYTGAKALLTVLQTPAQETLAAAKSGRVLSTSNLDKLKTALSVLQEILFTAEPPEEEDAKASLALTQAKYLRNQRQIEIAQRSLQALTL